LKELIDIASVYITLTSRVCFQNNNVIIFLKKHDFS